MLIVISILDTISNLLVYSTSIYQFLDGELRQVIVRVIAFEHITYDFSCQIN